MENDDEYVHEDNDIKMLIELIQITEQLESTFQYLIPNICDIANKSHVSTLSQTIKSDIQSLRFMMYDRFETFKNFKSQFEYDLMKICDHQWINDYIDKSEYNSQRIIYCEKCKLTKSECT
jgi:hypothetical protein